MPPVNRRVAGLARRSLGGGGFESSLRSQSSAGSIPVTWVTVHSDEHIGNTFGPKGFAIGSSLQVSSSKSPKSWRMKVTRRIRREAVRDCRFDRRRMRASRARRVQAGMSARMYYWRSAGRHNRYVMADPRHVPPWRVFARNRMIDTTNRCAASGFSARGGAGLWVRRLARARKQPLPGAHQYH